MGSFCPISRIAIIGAGPTGTACAKYLLAEKAFDQIDVFEQRDRVGGIWNLSSAERTKQIPIPQEDPYYGSPHASRANDTLERDGGPSGTNSDSLEFESPLYDFLEANIPKTAMQYSDFPFPLECPLYPSHQETLEYLERYADDIRPLIRFQTQVQDVKLLGQGPESGRERWEVSTNNLLNGSVNTTIYDAVVVANGHYTIPHVIDLTGVSDWDRAYPDSIIHSKAYRRPELFQGQRVLVIGNSASGSDIAGQIGTFCSRVYLASKSPSQFWSDSNSKREDIDEVVEFLPPRQYNRAIRTRSGKIVQDLDMVVFATGYLYSFPFLADLKPPIVTDGLRTRDMYLDFLHMEYPTLVFPVMNLKIIPFSLAENQAAVIARLWSGRLSMPSRSEMRQWEEQRIADKGAGKYFHLKKFPEEATQMNDLYKWAASAPPVPGLENDGQGKLGMFWDQRRVWLRSKFIEIKMAYAKMGNERRNIHTIEDLGFDYDSWCKNAPPEFMTIFEKAGCLRGVEDRTKITMS